MALPSAPCFAFLLYLVCRVGNGFVALVHGFVEDAIKQCRLVCGLLGKLVALCAVERALEIGSVLGHAASLGLLGIVLGG